MKICIVGTGYVGLVTGACLADLGIEVVGVDKDAEKIAMLKDGEIPIYEPGLKTLVQKNVDQGRLSFSTDLGTAIEQSTAIFIAVGTPPLPDGSTDLRFIRQVATSISEHLNSYKVIVTKSTVPIGTGKLIAKIVREGSRGAQTFAVVSNPEFLREGSAIEDFQRPDRVVIGTDDPKALGTMLDIYSPLRVTGVPFVTTNVESAELIKYASNSFLATKVSFINEVAELCERSGADVEVVAQGMGLDHRIGSEFLHPGPGFGGSCFPKDTSAMASISRDRGLRFRIVESVLKVNEHTRSRMVDKIVDSFGSLDGKRVAVLGLTFKPDTDDLRESPAISIIEGMLKLGPEVRAYDPVANEKCRALLPDVVFCDSAYEAAREADGLVIMTEWNQFRKLDSETLRSVMKQPLIVDLRNIYEPLDMARAGFRYVSVGRATVGPEA